MAKRDSVRIVEAGLREVIEALDNTGRINATRLDESYDAVHTQVTDAMPFRTGALKASGVQDTTHDDDEWHGTSTYGAGLSYTEYAISRGNENTRRVDAAFTAAANEFEDELREQYDG